MPLSPKWMSDHVPEKPKAGKLGKDEESQKTRANNMERAIADKLGGRRQPMSGALDGFKGDIKLDNFLLDSKQTSGAAILVQRNDLVKIDKEALGAGKIPGLALSFEKVADGVSRTWIVIPAEVFKAMIDAGMAKDL